MEVPHDSTSPLRPDTEPLTKKPRSRNRGVFLLKWMIFLSVFFAIVIGALSWNVASGTESGSFPSLSPLSLIKQFVGSNERMLNGEKDDRVNILLLGVGGAGHEGPQLSDTMLLASIKPSTKEVGMISIPRDLNVPIPDYGWRKINHANAYGEADERGTGPSLAASVVEDTFDEPIHYYVRVDFNGFAKLIDDIGGVDIYVDRAFTDSEYPILGKEDAECGPTPEPAEPTINPDTGEEIPGVTPAPDYSCRYEVLSFKEGWTHMDGDTALKYVRSRHGNNGEASDFARSRRQQKILLAVREQLLSASTVFNPARIGRILETLKEHIATNVELWEITRLANILKDWDPNTIKNHVLDTSDDSPLYATSMNGAYVLLPKNDDWGALQRLADNIFLDDGAIPASDTPSKPKFVKVEIQNGTAVSGLAFRTSQILDKGGYQVTQVGNAKTRGFEHTVIYDLTNGKRPDDLAALKDLLQADVTLSATGWIASGDVIPNSLHLTPEDMEKMATDSSVDFLVILGQNAENLVRN